MESVCSIENCQNQAEIVCSCKNVFICNSHISKHLSSEGLHSFESLYLEINPESKSILLSGLQKFSNDIDKLIKTSNRFFQSQIEKIYLESFQIEKELQNLKSKALNAIFSYLETSKFYKSSKNYFDVLLQKPPSEISLEISLWKTPSIQPNENLPEELMHFNKDCVPFEKFPSQKQISLVQSLKNTRSKRNIYLLGINLKEDEESQQILLSIIKSSATNPENSEIAWKAMNILSKNGFDFSHQNLRGINIQNAEIIGGKFTNTDFQDSNLAQVKLNMSVLDQAILNFQVLRSIEKGKSLFEGHLKGVTCAKVSPDSKFLVTGSEDMTLKVWEISSGHCLVTLEGHSDIVSSIDISEDCSEIVSGANDGVIKLWDTTTGECFHNYKELENPGQFRIAAVGITYNKAFIISGTWNNEVVIWNKDGSVYNKFQCASSIWSICIAMNRNNDYSWNVVAGSRRGELILMKTNETKPVWSQKNAHLQWISSVFISKNSNFLVSTGADDLIKIWVKAKGMIFNANNYQVTNTIKAHEGGIIGFAVFGNFKSIASVGFDRKIKVWDMKEAKIVGEKEKNKEIKCFDVCRNGSFVVFGVENKIEIAHYHDIFKNI